jgi:hypothetical protein
MHTKPNVFDEAHAANKPSFRIAPSCTFVAERTLFLPQASRPVYARLFSFSALLVSLLVLFVYFLCIGRPLLADPDVWWHLHNAQFLIQNHAFIHQDTYTFTVGGKTWINPEWLSELPYYFAWRWFGYRGLEVVAIAMIEAIILGVCLLSWQRIRSVKPALLACVFFLPMISVSFGPRTLMFGWLCLITELALLWEFRQGRDWLWSMPLLFLLWVNAHGSWPIGILLLAIYVASGFLRGSSDVPRWGSIYTDRWSPEQRSKLLRIFALSLVVLFINPYGWRLVAYPFHITIGHKLTMATVEEWQTLDFHALRGKLAYLIIAGLLTVNMARKRPWPLYELLFTLIAILAAFTYTRFLVLAGIIICPLLAREFTFFQDPDLQNDKPLLNFAIFAIVAGVLVTQIPSQTELHNQIVAAYPEEATTYLRTAKIDGPILNDFGWGGYLEWNAPSIPFFIDPRADVFDQWGVLQEYIDAASIKQPFEVMDKYRIRYVLFPKKSPIIYLLTHTPGWSTRYQDDTAVLLERDQPR